MNLWFFQRLHNTSAHIFIPNNYWLSSFFFSVYPVSHSPSLLPIVSQSLFYATFPRLFRLRSPPNLRTTGADKSRKNWVGQQHNVGRSSLEDARQQIGIGERIGMGRSAGNVGEQIGKRPIYSQFRLTNRPAESLEFILAFRPHSDLLAGASTVSARPVCASAGLLAWRVNRPARKPVRTHIKTKVWILEKMKLILEFSWKRKVIEYYFKIFLYFNIPLFNLVFI